MPIIQPEIKQFMQIVHRKKYDSFLVWLYLNDKEKLIPKHIRKEVPSSTVSTWKNNIDYNSYFGHEVRVVQQQALEQYMLLEENKQLKQLLWVITKSWLTVANILMPVIKSSEYHELLINEIQRLFTVMPKKSALKIAGISPSAFGDYLTRLKYKCVLSPQELCVKRHPLQLAQSEVSKIQALFADTDLVCWPASSIYYEGIRNRQLHISRSTFYKYIRLLGLTRPRYKRQSKLKGLVASKPNEYLHVDTTLWELENGQKTAIALVSDNFSKTILGSSVSLHSNSKNVSEAIEKSIQVIQTHHPEHVSCTLVADGGSENHAEEIELLLEQTEKPMFEKVIALKGIKYSNSPIEAINKIIKQYLRHYKPKTFEQTQQVVALAEHDYNENRPHGSLKGLIPMEAYTSPDKELSFKSEIQDAKKQRIKENRQENCLLCQQQS